MATDYPDDGFVVVCRDDTDAMGTPGPYVLATRRVFSTRQSAEAYAEGVAQGRTPLVIADRWHQLRFSE